MQPMAANLDQAKRARTRFALAENIAQRWSPRAFRPDALTQEQVGSLFEAARWAASSFNEQPWRFVYALQHEDPDAFARLLGTLMDMNQAWARKADLLAIASAQTTSSRNGRPNAKAIYDTGQAVATLSLQATALGLHVHQMGGFSAEAARAALHLPADWEPVVALAVGYRDAPETLTAELRARELMERERLPWSDFVFRGTARAPVAWSAE